MQTKRFWGLILGGNTKRPPKVLRMLGLERPASELP